jgi:hypothetical protein
MDGENMDDEALNMSMRKFLKTVGVNSQLAIEKAVRQAIESRKLKGDESLTAGMTLRIGRLDLEVRFDGEIRLG